MDEKYRVMWSFDILPEHIVPEFARDNPSEMMFQLSFPNQQAADQFVAEIQRYVGGLLIDLADRGIRLKAETNGD
jgi:hypothetical protein